MCAEISGYLLGCQDLSQDCVPRAFGADLNFTFNEQRGGVVGGLIRLLGQGGCLFVCVICQLAQLTPRDSRASLALPQPLSPEHSSCPQVLCAWPGSQGPPPVAAFGIIPLQVHQLGVGHTGAH